MRQRDAIFSGRVVAILATVAVVSFGLAFVLSAFGEDLSTPRSVGADTYSRSAIGHGALVELLRTGGIEIDVLRASPKSRADRRVGRWLIEPRIPRDLDDNPLGAAYDDLWTAHEAGAPSGALVIVAPKWFGTPHFKKPGWISANFEFDTTRFQRGLNGFLDDWVTHKVTFESAEESLDAACRLGDREIGRVAIAAPRTIKESTFGRDEELDIWEPWLVCAERVLVARSDPGEGPPIVLLSDPDLLNNQGLDDADHAAIVLELARAVAGDAERLAIDETAHGYGRSDSLVAELFRFPLVLAVLHGLLAVGIVVWAGSGRFGQPVGPPATPVDGKEILIDNAARLLLRGRHGIESLKVYLAHALRDVARHYALPPDLPHGERLSRLQHYTETRGLAADLAGWERAIERLPADRRVARERVARLARKIHTWREEMIDGHSAHR